MPKTMVWPILTGKYLSPSLQTFYNLNYVLIRFTSENAFRSTFPQDFHRFLRVVWGFFGWRLKSVIRPSGSKRICLKWDYSKTSKIVLAIQNLPEDKDNWSVILFFRYDHPNIMAGQGTLGLEIVEQVPDIDAVVVPVGGGGLIAGVATAIKTLHPRVKIIVSIFCKFLFILWKEKWISQVFTAKCYHPFIPTASTKNA